MTLVLKNALVFSGDGFVKNDIQITDSKITAIGTSVCTDGLQVFLIVRIII